MFRSRISASALRLPGLVLCSLFVLAGLLAAAQSQGPASAAHQCQLLTLDGELVGALDDLVAQNAAATVFVFTRTDCPIANRYMPQLAKLSQQFADRGVRLTLVYPDGDESASKIQQHLTDFGHPPHALRDANHSLVELCQAKVTPEAAVFLPSGKLAYLGPIDDRYAGYGQARAKATRPFLLAAVEAVLAGEQAPAAGCAAVGCPISPLH